MAIKIAQTSESSGNYEGLENSAPESVVSLSQLMTLLVA